MDKIDQLLEEVWKLTPRVRTLDEGECTLFEFSDWRGYVWLDALMNSGDFAWTIETARMAQSEFSYRIEWAIRNHNGTWLAQSKGLTDMLEKAASDGTH